jgi:hypothetical protein
MVARARAGAFRCIPYKRLTAEKFANGIKECLTDEARENVKKMAESIASEGDGAANAVKSFHRSLPLRGERSMRCSILEDRVAVWQLKNTSLRLSALAAEILVSRGNIKWDDLVLFRCYDWNDFDGPGEPITGGGMAIYRTTVGIGKGIGMIPVRAFKVVKHRARHVKKKKRYEARREKLQKANERTQPPTSDETLGDHEPQEDGKKEEAEESPPRSLHSNQPAPQQRRGTGFTDLSTLSADPSENVVEELAEETGEGLKKTGRALYRAPLDFTLAMAQGFHNAPRIYGDETVRAPPRIDGIASGLRAGRDELFYGIYDGFTGMVRLPAKGAKENGALGCLEGFGMGIGGLVLKNIAAFFGLFAFPAMGVRKRIQRGHQPIGFIRRARMRQGAKELEALQQRDRAEHYSESVNNALTANMDRHSMEEPRTLDRPETERRSLEEARKTEEFQVRGEEQQQQQQKEDDTLFTPRTHDKSLEAIEHDVEHGWEIVLTVLDQADNSPNRRFFHKFALKRETRKWRDAQALESVGTAKRALHAKSQGRDVAEELKRQREDVALANRPRLPAVQGQRRAGMNGSADLDGPVEQGEGEAVEKSNKRSLARAKTATTDFAVGGTST